MLPQSESIGPFRIERELARGGMGVVYVASHPAAGRQVALKVIDGFDAEERSRFEVEAQALAKLNHPNVVRVHSYGHHGGCPYLAMDLVEGRSLRDVLRAEGALAPKRAARIVCSLAEAMAHAHGAGILHRDLKPGNVLIEEQGDRPLIIDFGLAKDLHSEKERLTRTGEVLGTPAYMSPEQAEGDPRAIDARADVYALGAILYALLTGTAPFRGATLVNVLSQVLTKPPTKPRDLRPELDEDVEAICLVCLEKSPSERYPSAEALAVDLERYLEGQPVSARPRAKARRPIAMLGAGLVVLGALAGVAFGLASAAPEEEGAAPVSTEPAPRARAPLGPTPKQLEDARASLATAAAACEAGDLRLAKREWELAARWLPAAELRRVELLRARKHFERGKQRYDLSRPRVTRNTVETWLKSGPGPKALPRRLRPEEAATKCQEAIEDFDEAEEFGLRDGELFYYRALARYFLNVTNPAQRDRPTIADLRRALEAGIPAELEAKARSLLGNCLHNLGRDLDLAERELTRSLKIEARHDTYKRRSRLREEGLRNYEGALADSEQALSLASDPADVSQYRENVLRLLFAMIIQRGEAKDHGRVAQLLRRRIELVGSDREKRSRLSGELAGALARSGDRDGALEATREAEASATTPEQERAALRTRCDVHLAFEEFEAARSLAETLLEEDRRDAQALADLAAAKRGLEDLPGALEAARGALAVLDASGGSEAGKVKHLQVCAELEEALGEVGAAILSYERLAAGPLKEPAKQALERLAALHSGPSRGPALREILGRLATGAKVSEIRTEAARLRAELAQ